MFYLVAIRVERISNKFCNVRLTEFVLFATSFNPREIKNVVDECREPLALLTNDAVILLVFIGAREAT